MSCATDFLRAIAGTVLALIVAVLGCLTVASAANAEPPPKQVQEHGYDALDYDQPTTYTAMQRGPPAAHVSTAASAGQRAVDGRSHGTSARLLTPGTFGYTTYDAHAALGGVDRTAGATRRPVQAIGGDRSVLTRAADAAKAGSTGARATVHGSERLTQAGFTDDLIAQTRAGLATRQSDGANVFVREVTPGRFDFIVEGERGVVTAHRGWSQKSVDRLAKNYGWEGWPP